MPGTPAVPTASPGPSLAAPDPFVGQVVITVSDNLRVRSRPRVADDSIKYEPLLPLGTELQVIGGPVSASGYTWYRVEPVGVALRGGQTSGWVAMAGKDGDAWLATVDAETAGWPAVSRAGVTMSGAVGDMLQDGRLRFTISLTGLTPGEAVSLDAAGKYSAQWTCNSVPSGTCGADLGCPPPDFGRTEGTANATARAVSGSDGTVAVQIALVAAPPNERCSGETAPPNWRFGTWEEVTVANTAHGLVLTPGTIGWGVTY